MGMDGEYVLRVYCDADNPMGHDYNSAIGDTFAEAPSRTEAIEIVRAKGWVIDEEKGTALCDLCVLQNRKPKSRRKRKTAGAA